MIGESHLPQDRSISIMVSTQWRYFDFARVDLAAQHVEPQLPLLYPRRTKPPLAMNSPLLWSSLQKDNMTLCSKRHIDFGIIGTCQCSCENSL